VDTNDMRKCSFKVVPLDSEVTNKLPQPNYLSLLSKFRVTFAHIKHECSNEFSGK